VTFCRLSACLADPRACRVRLPQAIADFQTLLAEVQKNSGAVEKVVHTIAHARILEEPPPPAASETMGLQELYDLLEARRVEVCSTDRLQPEAQAPQLPQSGCSRQHWFLKLKAHHNSGGAHGTNWPQAAWAQPAGGLCGNCRVSCGAADGSMLSVCLQVVAVLVKKYKSIGPLLRKIEEAVAGTNTGRSPQLAGPPSRCPIMHAK
jgi:hypothetical protein